MVYAWDSRGRLKSVTKGAQSKTFSYDYSGNLISQTDSGVGASFTKTFIVDDLSNIAFSSGTNGDLSVLSGRSIDSHLATIQPSGEAEYALTDAINSTIATVDSNAAIKSQFGYDSFGQTTTSSYFPFQFSGRVPISDGLYYFRSRYYSPATGRFISEDPIGLVSVDTNLYRYAGNNPVSLVDPRGLAGFSPTEEQIQVSERAARDIQTAVVISLITPGNMLINLTTSALYLFGFGGKYDFGDGSAFGNYNAGYASELALPGIGPRLAELGGGILEVIESGTWDSGAAVDLIRQGAEDARRSRIGEVGCPRGRSLLRSRL